MANYTVNHIKQIIIIGEKALSHQEDIEIADLVSRGYKVKQQAKRTSTKGKNAEWYKKQLPDDAAREEFERILNETKGLKGFANAKKWAKEQHNIK